MNRRYTADAPTIRKILQTFWYQVNNGQEIYVIGTIQDDGTVHGGTGWSVELARRFKKVVWVFDQEKNGWFWWDGANWQVGLPVVQCPEIAGTGTRFLSDTGRRAIVELFDRSFGG